MSDAELRIAATELLYRTRGRDWDYAFLLQPPPLLGEGWYTLHRRIFAHVEPTDEPLLLRGELGIGLGHPFFATVFTDDSRRDSQDRPIAHYLAWLGKSAEAAPGLSYGPGLVSTLAPALDAVFDLSPHTLVSGQTKPLDALLRARFQSTLTDATLTARASASGSLRWLGTIAV